MAVIFLGSARMSSKTKSTATKEEARPALVPKLRFPEFREAEGWVASPLGELGAIVTGKTPSTTEEDLWGGEILFITPTDITDVNKYQRTTQRTVVETSGAKVLPPGSVVYTCIASIGKMALTVVPSVTNQQINAVVPNCKTAKEYIYYSLEKLTPWIKSIPATSTLPIINKTQFSGFIVPHPQDKAEQQKIADCLSSADDLIAAQARKVDALKTHKKGLMQQLFPREGETQPRLRFPEFQNAGEWDDQTVGDFGKVVTGNTPSTAQPTFYGGGIPFVSPADISDLRFVDQTKTTLTPEGYAETRPIRAGSILFVCIGSTIGKVAQNVSDCATNQQINAVIPSPKHSDGFVYFALSLASERIARLAGRQAVPIINKSLFSSVRILVPPLPEQQRIASCLSSLDALIADEIQKIEVITTLKKGLMQQLFPSVEKGSQ